MTIWKRIKSLGSCRFLKQKRHCYDQHIDVIIRNGVFLKPINALLEFVFSFIVETGYRLHILFCS